MPKNEGSSLAHTNIISLLVALALITAVGFLVLYYKLDLETRSLHNGQERFEEFGMMKEDMMEVLRQGSKGMEDERKDRDEAEGSATIGDGTRITLGVGESYRIDLDGNVGLAGALGRITIVDINDSRCNIYGQDCSAQGEVQVVLKVSELPYGRSQLLMLGTKSESCVDSYIGGIDLVEAEPGYVTLLVDENCM